MQRILAFLFAFMLLASCGSSKKAKVVTKRDKQTNSSTSSAKSVNWSTNAESTSTADYSTIKKIIKEAESYRGTRYKYGGTTKKGMDCSGLVTTAFKSENIALPRSTGELSSYGDWVDLKEVKEGDLLFFATSKNSRKVNHVGLVVDARPGFVQFIHSTTSAGVITSKLSERYWYFAFVQARRVM